MALLKEKILQNGVTASYWRIKKYVVDRKIKQVSYYLDLFYTSSSIISLGCEKLIIVNLTAEEMAGDLVALGYNKIKEVANSNELEFNPMKINIRELKNCVDT